MAVFFGSTVLALGAARLLASDLQTVSDFLFLEGVEAPLIEPWFFTHAFVWTAFVFFGAVVLRSVFQGHRFLPLYLIALIVQLAAILNSSEFYFFVPPHFVAGVVIAAVFILLALALVDIWQAVRVIQKDRKGRPNKPVQSNAVDAPRNPGAVTEIARSPRRV